MSSVEVQSDEQFMSLKVMRLTPPSLAFQPGVYNEVPSAKDNTLLLPGCQNGSFSNFDLSSMLSVPTTIETIYLGETFSSYICVNNETGSTLQHMTLKVELQATFRHFSLIDTTITPQDIKPFKAAQYIVHHEVKELGMHFLLCSVHYVAPNQERKFFKKIYKVNVLNPLAVKTKANNLKTGGVVLLEVQIQNLSASTMYMESMRFEPVSFFIHKDLNFIFKEGSKNISQQEIPTKVIEKSRITAENVLKHLSPEAEPLSNDTPSTQIPIETETVSFDTSTQPEKDIAFQSEAPDTFSDSAVNKKSENSTSPKLVTESEETITQETYDEEKTRLKASLDSSFNAISEEPELEVPEPTAKGDQSEETGLEVTEITTEENQLEKPDIEVPGSANEENHPEEPESEVSKSITDENQPEESESEVPQSLTEETQSEKPGVEAPKLTAGENRPGEPELEVPGNDTEESQPENPETEVLNPTTKQNQFEVSSPISTSTVPKSSNSTHESERIGVFGNFDYIKTNEVRQYLYKLFPKDINNNEAYITNELGKLDIVWRSSFCGTGRLQTSQLTRRPPLLEMVELRVVSLPDRILLEIPFLVECRVHNRTREAMNIEITTDRTKLGSILFCGLSPLNLGSIAAGSSHTFSLQYLPLTPGPHKLGGLIVLDQVTKTSHAVETLTEVFVNHH